MSKPLNCDLMGGRNSVPNHGMREQFTDTSCIPLGKKNVKKMS